MMQVQFEVPADKVWLIQACVAMLDDPIALAAMLKLIEDGHARQVDCNVGWRLLPASLQCAPIDGAVT